MNIKWNFLLLAFLAAASMAGIGISVGERSLIGIIICILALIGIMGYGFATKKKMREQGKLK
ncbi:hypothetical protein D0469_04085 [Peribacillus saganii]|uniref:YlaF family protein n=1 Tax=Peribacillus saganii TaxID=2303992 RepID=A0A372LSV0_9BACI|nr:YlaF family protein [Peribacillus saganii]RFU71126.1 hypothetical protein D0469_04085 [Peribacillus saganii]